MVIDPRVFSGESTESKSWRAGQDRHLSVIEPKLVGTGEDMGPVPEGIVDPFGESSPDWWDALSPEEKAAAMGAAGAPPPPPKEVLTPPSYVEESQPEQSLPEQQVSTPVVAPPQYAGPITPADTIEPKKPEPKPGLQGDTYMESYKGDSYHGIEGWGEARARIEGLLTGNARDVQQAYGAQPDVWGISRDIGKMAAGAILEHQITAPLTEGQTGPLTPGNIAAASLDISGYIGAGRALNTISSDIMSGLIKATAGQAIGAVAPIAALVGGNALLKWAGDGPLRNAVSQGVVEATQSFTNPAYVQGLEALATALRSPVALAFETAAGAGGGYLAGDQIGKAIAAVMGQDKLDDNAQMSLRLFGTIAGGGTMAGVMVRQNVRLANFLENVAKPFDELRYLTPVGDLAKAIDRVGQEAHAVAQGFDPSRLSGFVDTYLPQYPGGYNQFALDTIRTMFTDRYARLQTATQHAILASQAGRGKGLASDENLLTQAYLSAGIDGRVDTFYANVIGPILEANGFITRQEWEDANRMMSLMIIDQLMNPKALPNSPYGQVAAGAANQLAQHQPLGGKTVSTLTRQVVDNPAYGFTQKQKNALSWYTTGLPEGPVPLGDVQLNLAFRGGRNLPRGGKPNDVVQGVNVSRSFLDDPANNIGIMEKTAIPWYNDPSMPTSGPMTLTRGRYEQLFGAPPPNLNPQFSLQAEQDLLPAGRTRQLLGERTVPQVNLTRAEVDNPANGFTPEQKQAMLWYKNGKPSGLVTYDRAQWDAAYNQQVNEFNTKYLGGGFQRVTTALAGITSYHNDLLREAEMLGRLKPGEAQRIIDGHESYLAWMNVSRHASQRALAPDTPIVSGEKGVALEGPDAHVSVADLMTTYTRDQGFFRALQHQRVSNAVMAMREIDPWLMDEMPEWTHGLSMQPPHGFDIWSTFVKGEEKHFLAPEWLHKTLLGLDGPNADMLTQGASAVNRVFRAGVTTYSIPFMLRNIPRDLQVAYENVGLPHGFWASAAAWAQAAYELAAGRDIQLGRAALNAAPGVGLLAGSLLGAQSAENPDQARLTIPGGALTGATLGAGLFTAPRALRNGIGHAQYEAISGAIAQMLDRMILGPDGRMRRGGATEMLQGGVRGSGLASSQRAPGSSDLFRVMGSSDSSVGEVITGPLELMRAFAEVGELATRAAVYNVKYKELNDVDAALGWARGATTDFQKGGNAMKLLAKFVPLLNARVQGTLRSVQAAQENPWKYASRVAMLGLPVAWAEWVHNHDPEWNDVYEKIPQATRDRNHIVMFGKIPGGMLGDERPLYWTIPKDDVIGMFTNVMHAAFDTMFKGTYQGVPLAPEQRVERTNWQLWRDMAARAAPVNLTGDQITRPWDWGLAALQSNPGLDVIIGLAANRDNYYDRDIVPAEQINLPKRYQIGAPDSKQLHPSIQYATYLADHSMVGAAFKSLFGQDASLAPAQTAYAIDHLLGTGGSLAVGAADKIVTALGLIPPPPSSYAELQPPRGTSPEAWDQYLNTMQLPVQRPAYAQFLTAIGATGMASGQQTLSAKMKLMSPGDQEKYKQTNGYFSRVSKETTRISEQQAAIAADKELTAIQKINQIMQLNVARQQISKAILNDFPKAVIDPRVRDEWYKQVPGIPIKAGLYADVADLPAGVDINQLRMRYSNPQGMTLQELAALGPQGMAQAQNIELQKMALETKVSPRVLLDHIRANEGGRSLPLLNLPATYLEEAMNRWRAPDRPNTNPDAPVVRTPDGTRPAMTYEKVDENGLVAPDSRMLSAARELEIQRMAQEWGIDPATLKTRIMARLLPEVQNKEQVGMERALQFSADYSDPIKYPPLMQQVQDANGNVLMVPLQFNGQPLKPSDMEKMVAQIQIWKKDPLQAFRHRDMIKAMQLADAYRLEAMWEDREQKAQIERLKQQGIEAPRVDNRYFDYDRWFGLGRTMKDDEWSKMMGGGVPEYARYKIGTPAEWTQWDIQQKMYRTLPVDSRVRMQLARSIATARRYMNPKWRAQMDYDDLQGEIAKGVFDDLDRVFQERTQ